MARKPRVEYPGAVYHVMARGNERTRIFRNEADARLFLTVLEAGLRRFHAEVHAWCLMPNHYHLALQTHEPTLSRLMAWVQTTFTVRYNRTHRRVGHLFQGRYRAELVDADTYASTLVRYIHLNPVRRRSRGQVIYTGRWENLQTYRWSSHRSWTGMEKPLIEGQSFEWLRYWGRRLPEARKAYRLDIQQELRRKTGVDWKSCVLCGLVAGGEDLLERVENLLQRKPDAISAAWKLEERAARRRVIAEELLAQETDRRWRIWLRVEGKGEKRVDVARDLGYRDGGSVLQILKRLEARAASSPQQARKLKAYQRRLSSVED